MGLGEIHGCLSNHVLVAFIRSPLKGALSIAIKLKAEVKPLSAFPLRNQNNVVVSWVKTAAQTNILAIIVGPINPPIILRTFFHHHKHPHPSIAVFVGIMFRILLAQVEDTLGMLF